MTLEYFENSRIGMEDNPGLKWTNLFGEGELNENNLSYWPVLCGKGYTGLTEVFHKVRQVKSYQQLTHSLAECSKPKISFDRVFAENYFGRLCTFTLFGAKWNWDQHKYATFLHFYIFVWR